jgi:hypothetical protein
VRRDRPSRSFIRLAIEQYGSEAHLARALGVTREQLVDWKEGREDPPPEILQAIADAIQSARKTPD